MPRDSTSRIDSVYLSYLPEEGSPQRVVKSGPPPAVTVTSAPAASPNDGAFRRPLHLGIATAAANNAARSAVANAHGPAQQEHQQQQQPSRVQQKLQRDSPNGSSPNSGQAPPRYNVQLPQQQPSSKHVRALDAPAAGSNGTRPLELRGNLPHQQYQQQQQAIQQSRRPMVPALHVTVPQPSHQPVIQYQNQQRNQPISPFSSSSDTLVGSPYDKNKQGGGGGKPGDWSPSSSHSSSSHSGLVNNMPSTPRFNSPYGHHNPPPSPSIKNLQLQIPQDKLAHPDNDRLSPAIPRGAGASQRDWWKRFSTVVRENEEREMLAEKTGAKGSKAQSEWLDRQAHKQRTYRIWVAVVAVLILAGIGGGLAYHYLTKGDNKNAVTTPTTHNFGIDTDTTTSKVNASSTGSSRPVSMAAPSAVQAGSNNLDTRSFSKRAEAPASPGQKVAKAHHAAIARRQRSLQDLD